MEWCSSGEMEWRVSSELYPAFIELPVGQQAGFVGGQLRIETGCNLSRAAPAETSPSPLQKGRGSGEGPFFSRPFTAPLSGRSSFARRWWW